MRVRQCRTLLKIPKNARVSISLAFILLLYLCFHKEASKVLRLFFLSLPICVRSMIDGASGKFARMSRAPCSSKSRWRSLCLMKMKILFFFGVCLCCENQCSEGIARPSLRVEKSLMPSTISPVSNFF